MKKNQLLRAGTLILFASMIGGLVYYQSRGEIREQPKVQASMTPVSWFDSAQFQTELEHALVNRFPSTKVAIVFKPSDDFSRHDTFRALEIFLMRNEVTKLPDMLLFQAECNKRYSGREEPRISTYDSLQIWKELKFQPHRVVQLTPTEKQRFQAILDSLLRPRLMSSKSGIIFRHKADTMQALQILNSRSIPK